ncbi:MAG: thioredoxin domain-containing protein [Nanoarchaeota archaeon]
MKEDSKLWWLASLLLMIAFVATVFIFFPGTSEARDSVIVDQGSPELAKCLTEKGAIMYGAEWCSHCQNQKSMFGESVKEINFVDCDAERERCLSAGIQGYPTWSIDGKLYPGEQELSRLAELSGC